MPIKVAHIPNLECEAFYYDMERRGIELLNLEPNAVTEALERGEVDAGPVPLVDTWRLADKSRPGLRVLRCVGVQGHRQYIALEGTHRGPGRWAHSHGRQRRRFGGPAPGFAGAEVRRKLRYRS